MVEKVLSILDMHGVADTKLIEFLVHASKVFSTHVIIVISIL